MDSYTHDFPKFQHDCLPFPIHLIIPLKPAQFIFRYSLHHQTASHLVIYLSQVKTWTLSVKPVSFAPNPTLEIVTLEPDTGAQR